MALHIEYCSKWGICEEDTMSAQEDKACITYTWFVLELGLFDDILDLYVALSPCLVGYGVMGYTLSMHPETNKKDNPYSSWIAMYPSPKYLQLVNSVVEQLDRLNRKGAGNIRFDNLLDNFRTATRFETDFWQMGINKLL
jgi:thiaminase/transcriptional activator TenA